MEHPLDIDVAVDLGALLLTISVPELTTALPAISISVPEETTALPAVLISVPLELTLRARGSARKRGKSHNIFFFVLYY